MRGKAGGVTAAGMRSRTPRTGEKSKGAGKKLQGGSGPSILFHCSVDMEEGETWGWKDPPGPWGLAAASVPHPYVLHLQKSLALPRSLSKGAWLFFWRKMMAWKEALLTMSGE